ncbi:CsiV family protein [Dasania marina]|uniref:CsiV family protein n=1 Tax=Dasania marina TaxID=471499 RepID=UPI0003672357|nr:CsiV family protein [Dasania marina]
MIYRRIAPLFAAFSLYAHVAVAEGDSPQPQPQQWYQVEMLVFANNNPDAALGEQWPEELGLKYPAAIINLQPPISAITTESPLPSLTGLQTAASADQAQPSITPLKAFVTLPTEQHQLTEVARNVNGEYAFRPLFHQAWRQTIDERDESLSIVITGGAAFDNHFELEGSIKISVERYLHIHTDLWLNRFISNVGDEQPNWPLLPPIPQSLDERDASQLPIAPPSLMTEDNGLPAAIEQAPATDPLQGANQFLAQQLAYLQDNHYRVEKTIVMRQHRRMRSDELHYIDHPLMGVLIRITPYQANVEGADTN